MLEWAKHEGQEQIIQTLTQAGKQADHEAIIAGGKLWGAYKTATEKIDAILDDLPTADIALPTEEEQTNAQYHTTEAYLQQRVQQADPLATTIAFGKLYEGYALGVALTVMRLEEATHSSRSREEVPDLVRSLDTLAHIRKGIEDTLATQQEELQPLLHALTPYTTQSEIPPQAQELDSPESIWLKVHEGFIALTRQDEPARPSHIQLPQSELIVPEETTNYLPPPEIPLVTDADRDVATLGEMVRIYRLNANLSQGDIAQQLNQGQGRSHSYLSGIERGTTRPSPEMLEDLMQVLGIPEADRIVMRNKLGTQS